MFGIVSVGIYFRICLGINCTHILHTDRIGGIHRVAAELIFLIRAPHNGACYSESWHQRPSVPHRCGVIEHFDAVRLIL